MLLHLLLTELVLHLVQQRALPIPILQMQLIQMLQEDHEDPRRILLLPEEEEEKEEILDQDELLRVLVLLKLLQSVLKN